jgi:formate dehydrogenase major subunit
VPGLGTSYGRGGATTFAMDMKHADSIMIMGSNMAECHPVAFRWVMQARTREKDPCKLIHVDPRFTRTSAMANIYAPLRAGSDIVFLGALINQVLQKLGPIFAKEAGQRSARERFFHDYLVHYTNAPTLISKDYQDTEDDGFAGLFSGFDAQGKKYNVKKWRYEGQPADERAEEPSGNPEERKPHSFPAQVGKLVGPPPEQDLTLQKEQCVFQILCRHYARYTPEMVEQVCGTPKKTFLEVAETLWSNAGPDRTGAICYAVGWTQHTVGVQIIRAAAVLQLLLGNVGRPGGGILALRGHATIQGSTDIATLYNIHPGYLNTPSALQKHDTLYDYMKKETSPTSYWVNFPKFIVSQLKAWYGDAATEASDFAYDYLPRIVGDHSHMPMFVDMHAGKIQGFFAMGQNPAVGGQNASFQRQALARLKWMVVRDLYETETASFWKDSPEVKGGKLKPEEIETEVFFLPAAAVAEMDGSFTNTQRLVQWHEKAVDPPDEARSDIWFTYHLGRRLQELYRSSKKERDRPIQALVWNYMDPKGNERWQIRDEPSAELILKEINGYQWVADQNWKGKESPLVKATALATFNDLKVDGTTACGAWIYTGILTQPTKEELEEAARANREPPRWHNHAANRKGDEWVALGWGFAWPANRRLMYNRCSADPKGQPWPKEARLARQYPQPDGQIRRGYVYWDPEALFKPTGKKGMWVGLDVPDFVLNKPPGAPANPKGEGLAFHDGASPFIMKADGKGWLFVPNGLVDGPLPTHYEPYESPVTNALYRQQSNPVALTWNVLGNPYAPVGSPEYPHVLSTYRLTEHHLSGVMSRWLPWLVELQPELFCELSPEHAREIGVVSKDWVEISTPRGSIRARALVTPRIRPYRLKDKTVHHVGLPWHWGYKGLTTGDVVNNLSALVGDPNVTIHEAKVFVCNVKKAEGSPGP